MTGVSRKKVVLKDEVEDSRKSLSVKRDHCHDSRVCAATMYYLKAERHFIDSRSNF